MIELSRLPQADRLVFLAASVFIIIAGIKLVSDFIGPLIVAAFAAIIFSIISNWLMRKGFSPRVANMISFALFIIALAGMFLLIVLSVAPLIENLMSLQQDYNGNLNSVQSFLDNSGINVLQMVHVNDLGNSLSSYSVKGVSVLVNQVSALMIVIFSTLFLLLEASGFSRKIQKIVGDRNQVMLSNVQEFGEILVEYIIIRTKVNFAIGVIFTIALFILGVEGAPFWGFLMFMLGYVPYVGFVLAIIPPAFYAWLELSPMTALLVVLIAVLINSIAENILFPQLAGKGLQLSPAVIFISLIFWGFLLGGSGIILGVPLTVFVYTILKSSEDTKWIAYLMSLDSGEDLSDPSGVRENPL